MLWNAVIFGPVGTPFEDGTFKLLIEFSEEYPNKPPTVRFVSRMFHPNVYADGSICLDILQNRWSPTYDVSSILTSIQSLLDEPNPNSPANSQAAQLYQENKREYEKRVTAIVEQSWVDVWARLAPLLFSPSASLHHPSTSVSHFYLIKRKKKNSNYIRRTQVPPWKKKKTTKPEWTLTCLPIHFRKMREGISILYLCFLSLILLFLLHDVK